MPAEMLLQFSLQAEANAVPVVRAAAPVFRIYKVVQGACSRERLGACPFLFAPQRRAKALIAQKHLIL
jgi:hypothetical protein